MIILLKGHYIFTCRIIFVNAATWRGRGTSQKTSRGRSRPRFAATRQVWMSSWMQYCSMQRYIFDIAGKHRRTHGKYNYSYTRFTRKTPAPPQYTLCLESITEYSSTTYYASLYSELHSVSGYSWPLLCVCLEELDSRFVDTT